MGQVADRRDAKAPDTEPSADVKKALIHGWKPKEEYSGEADKWVDAKVFNDRADSSMAIKNERSRKLEDDVSKLTDEKAELLAGQKELKDMMDEFVVYHKDVSKREYDKAVLDIEGRKKEAVADGDTEVYDRLDKEQKDLVKPVEAKEDPKTDPTLAQWVAKNSWFNTDEVLNASMQAEHTLISKRQPGISLEENLKLAKEKVMERFPTEFGIDPDASVSGKDEEAPAQAVEGGRPPSQDKGKKSYANLPDEAKEACDKFVAQGLLTEEKYLEEYNWL